MTDSIFECLPPEILNHLFSFLRYSSMIQARATCKLFAQYIPIERVWRVIINNKFIMHKIHAKMPIATSISRSDDYPVLGISSESERDRVRASDQLALFHVGVPNINLPKSVYTVLCGDKQLMKSCMSKNIPHIPGICALAIRAAKRQEIDCFQEWFPIYDTNNWTLDSIDSNKKVLMRDAIQVWIVVNCNPDSRHYEKLGIIAYLRYKNTFTTKVTNRNISEYDVNVSASMIQDIMRKK